MNVETKGLWTASFYLLTKKVYLVNNLGIKMCSLKKIVFLIKFFVFYNVMGLKSQVKTEMWGIGSCMFKVSRCRPRPTANVHVFSVFLEIIPESLIVICTAWDINCETCCVFVSA